MDDWGHVLGALVLIIDETFNARKTVHEVSAVAHTKEIKGMQTTISKLMTTFSDFQRPTRHVKLSRSLTMPLLVHCGKNLVRPYPTVNSAKKVHVTSSIRATRARNRTSLRGRNICMGH